jgi:tRNA(fMet)-specific endonuclease VapC
VTAALLDTDTTIALLRGDETVARKARQHPPQSLGISAVTLYELRVGVEKSKDPAKNRRFLADALAPFALLLFDDSASMEAAKIRAVLEKRGKGIGPYDTLIAGHALAAGARLVTANTREFGRVPGLKLENWISR